MSNIIEDANDKVSSFDEILDKRKILICNLAKGKLGEDTSEVLGIMIDYTHCTNLCVIIPTDKNHFNSFSFMKSTY